MFSRVPGAVYARWAGSVHRRHVAGVSPLVTAAIGRLGPGAAVAVLDGLASTDRGAVRRGASLPRHLRDS